MYSILYIIGAIVVIIVVLRLLGLFVDDPRPIGENLMYSILYIIGAIVVIIVVLRLLGLY